MRRIFVDIIDSVSIMTMRNVANFDVHVLVATKNQQLKFSYVFSQPVESNFPLSLTDLSTN